MKIRFFVIKKLFPFFSPDLSLRGGRMEGGGEGGGDTGHPRNSARRERLENSLVLQQRRGPVLPIALCEIPFEGLRAEGTSKKRT